MKSNRFDHPNSIRLFEQDFLERLTHVHPAVPALIWVPVVIFFISNSLLTDSNAFFVLPMMAIAGVMVWTLTEYVVHRFLFHFTPTGKYTARLVYLFHGIHHHTPGDATRLVMPPIVSITFGVVIYHGATCFMPQPWGDHFFAFFVVGYLCYDYTHYFVHHAKARSRLGRFLKTHHMQHHFGEANTRFGLSSPLWDALFGTYKSGKVGRK